MTSNGRDGRPYTKLKENQYHSVAFLFNVTQHRISYRFGTSELIAARDALEALSGGKLNADVINPFRLSEI